MSALETQVVSTKKELQEMESEAKDKLTHAGDHVKQSRQEVAGLKAKVWKFLLWAQLIMLHDLQTEINMLSLS